MESSTSTLTKIVRLGTNCLPRLKPLLGAEECSSFQLESCCFSSLATQLSVSCCIMCCGSSVLGASGADFEDVGCIPCRYGGTLIPPRVASCGNDRAVVLCSHATKGICVLPASPSRESRASPTTLLGARANLCNGLATCGPLAAWIQSRRERAPFHLRHGPSSRGRSLSYLLPPLALHHSRSWPQCSPTQAAATR